MNAPAIGTTTPSSVGKVYESLTPSVCTATAAGVVEGLDDDETCQVLLTLSKSGYNDRTHTYSFTVQKGTIAVTGNDWGSYATVAVGADAVPAPAVVYTPTDAVATYTPLTTSVCNVDSDGAVTGLDDDTCSIKLVLSKSSYDDLEHTYTFTVVKGRIKVAGATASDKWGEYTGVIVGGSAVNAPSIGTTTPSSTPSYRSLTGTVCTATGAGVVEGLDDANCRVELTLTADNYDDRVYTYDFNVGAGTIAVDGADTAAKWGTYASVTVGAGGASAPSIGTTTPVSVDKEYSSLTQTLCRAAADGTVTGLDDGTCQVKLILSKDGYADLPHTYNITVQAGTMAIDGADSAAKWGAYGDVRVGEEATAAPTIGTVTPSGADKTYDVGTGSAGCTVDGDGAVTGTAHGTDNCKIKLTLSETGYDNLEHTYTMSVLKGIQNITWNPGATSVRAADGELVLDGVTGADGSATVSYRVTGNGGASVNCRWKGSSGANARTLLFDGAGTCTVEAGSTLAQYGDWTSDPVTVTINTNPTVQITWSGYPNSNSAAFGDANVQPTPPQTTPSGASVTYASTGNGCSAVADGTLTINGVGSCTVTATASETNYDDGTAQVTFTVNEASQDAPAPGNNYYGSSPSLVTGGTLGIGQTVPTGGHGSIRYRSGSDTICTVDPGNGGITAILNGPCVVQARWTGDGNYLESGWGTIRTIQVGKGTLSVTPGSFTGNLVVGGASKAPSVPTISPSEASHSYALASGENDCLLDSSTGATLGTVSAATVAVTPGTTSCTLELTATLNGYNSKTVTIEVLLEGQRLAFSTNAAPDYPENEDDTLALEASLI